jgi:plastocyanin
MKTAVFVLAALTGILSPRPSADPPASRVVGAGGTVTGRVTIRGAKGGDGLKQFLLLNHYAISKALQLDEKQVAGERDEYPLSERAIVYLESPKLDRGSYELPARRPVLDQRNLAFHPKALAVLVGTTVDFPNHDALFHNVFSYSQPKEFDLGRYPKGDSRPVIFDKPGIVSVYCDIHAHMNAVVLVLEHPYFTSPDNDGFYTIANIPEGSYTVKFWYDRDPADERKITVKNGETVTVNFEW